MPLHAEGEALRTVGPERLDQPVARQRLDRQPLAQAFHALRVQGIDPHGVGAGERMQHPSRHQADLVRRSVLHFERLVLVLAVIEQSLHLVQRLMQRAAEGDVHLLEAAADAEHRHAALHRRADQRQRGGVAIGIVQGTGLARRTP